MRRRKQDAKQETEQYTENTENAPVITFAFLSVNLTGATGANFLAWLATAARSPSEQQDLWKQAEGFFKGVVGCMGPLIKVHGDLQPAASYLILSYLIILYLILFDLAPGVKLHRDMVPAPEDFVTACASFKTLQVELQMGRSAVVDNGGEELDAYLLQCVFLRCVLLPWAFLCLIF